MAWLSYLFENAEWIAPVLSVASALCLLGFIRRAISTLKKARLLAVPLVPTQEIDFVEKGWVVLCTEGPLLSTRFGGLGYELTLLGRAVARRPSLLRVRTSGLSSVRTQVCSFELPVRGRYVLSVTGLDATATTDAAHDLVFMRPHLASTLVNVIGIVVASLCLIGSLVLFSLELIPNATPT